MACAQVPSTHAVTPMAAPAIAPVAALTITDRGHTIELMQGMRARPAKAAASAPGVIGTLRDHVLMKADNGAVLAVDAPAVVYNRTTRMYGLASGEIAFKLKPGRTMPAEKAAALPGFISLVPPDVFAIAARSHAEYVRLVQQLQGRDDVEWVEPQIKYGPAFAK